MSVTLRLVIDLRQPDRPGFTRPVATDLHETVGWLLATRELAPLSPEAPGVSSSTVLGPLARDHTRLPFLAFSVLRLPIWPPRRITLPALKSSLRHLQLLDELCSLLEAWARGNPRAVDYRPELDGETPVATALYDVLWKRAETLHGLLAGRDLAWITNGLADKFKATQCDV